MTEVASINELNKQPIAQTTNDEQVTEYVAPSIGAILGGVYAGNVVNCLVSKKGTSIVGSKVFNKMNSLQISKRENSSLFTQAKKALEKTGLKEQGVKILEAGKTGITDWFPNKKDGFLKKLMNIQMTMAEGTVENGQNAFFAPGVNKVVIPPKGKGVLSLSVFHEIGHAMNYNKSTIGKLLQKSRGLTLLAIPIAIIALWKTKKADGEQPTGIVDKTTDFIKNNAGKLTFASLLPMLMEEGLASIKGGKLAKELLKPELAKKVCKLNKLAYLTYLSLAIFSGLGIYGAVSLKDKIAGRNVIDYNKHFDFDKDGELNSAEKVAKETYLNGRKAEKEKLFNMFDFNKNGELEPEEKSAMEAYKKAS